MQRTKHGQVEEPLHTLPIRRGDRRGRGKPMDNAVMYTGVGDSFVAATTSLVIFGNCPIRQCLISTAPVLRLDGKQKNLVIYRLTTLVGHKCRT